MPTEGERARRPDAIFEANVFMHDSRSDLGLPMRVRRTSGLLIPGFSKRWSVDPEHGIGVGTTSLWRVPIGRFAVISDHPDLPGVRALRYVRWPVVDLLTRGEDGAWRGEGWVRLLGRSRRFCTFTLDPAP